MGQIQIAILIPVFNGLKYTKQCLNLLHSKLSQIDKSDAEFKIIVIDDGSSDGTYEWISRTFKNIVILKGNGNLWWSGGINKGVEYVIENKAAKYTLWWNNDIISEENYFVELIRIVKTYNKTVIIGPVVYDLKTDEIWSKGGIFNAKTGVYHQSGIKTDGNIGITEADWLPGMGTLVPIEAYQKVGLLDFKNFPQYHGDLDFTLRCKLSGYKILVFPDLKIYNDKSNSGFVQKESWKDVIYSLNSLKSIHNVKKDIRLYKKHTVTPYSYMQLLKKYTRFIGGYFKWKLLNYIGIRRKSVS